MKPRCLRFKFSFVELSKGMVGAKGSPPCQGSGGVVTVNRCISMGTNANTQGVLSLRGFAPPPSSEGGLGVCKLVTGR